MKKVLFLFIHTCIDHLMCFSFSILFCFVPSDVRTLKKKNLSPSASLHHSFFLERSPLLARNVGAPHTGHLCLVFKGLGPSMAGQDIERYGQKNTSALFQNSNLTLLKSRDRCRATSESTHTMCVSLSFSLSLSLPFFLCLSMYLCIESLLL